ncbi:hypothetical protein ALC53_02027 [Atta colombica]|uniref:Uncharacterized protein n=1 Tax=Atta colombica TaxID=520822 RepID=A0A195BRS2_9HYME|nr:hypothetical protein ALC53_02027 [Atta colombica]
MVVDPTTLLPVVSGALSKNPSENREALVDVVVSCGTSEGRKKTPARWRARSRWRDKIAKGSREILHKVAYVTVLSNPWQTALICSVESFTSFRPKRNAPRDHEVNRNWLRDIPRECENCRDGTDLAKQTITKRDQSCFHFPRLGHDKATVRVKRIVSLGLTLDYTQMRRSMHRFMQRINKFLNSQKRRSLRYKCETREYCPVRREKRRKETGFHNREHKSVLEHLFPNKKWLSTQHIYRSIVRGLRPFANAAGVDVAKMNDPPFFKKDPQRGPGFTQKVVAMSLINATCS